jgi:predicted small lipoprotein YifL
MKGLVLTIILALAACSTPGPATFSHPPKDAPVWNLNQGTVQGTNDLIRPPSRIF